MRPAEGVPARSDAQEVAAAPAAPATEGERPSAQPAEASRHAQPVSDTVTEEPDMPEGVFHRVEPGQTLWRIARAYGVDLKALADTNQVDDPRTVATGRMLFVPGASLQLDVPPYPAPPPPAHEPLRPLAEAPEPSAEPGEFVWPVSGGEILSVFGVPRRNHRHAGVDIRGTSGQDVLAAARGEVVYSGASPGGYGKLVILDHGEGLQTLYAHNSRIVVHAGEAVERGQIIARVGRTGNATTDHCHFEIRKDKVAVNPLDFYPDRVLTASRARATAPAIRATAGSSRRSSPVSAENTADR